MNSDEMIQYVNTLREADVRALIFAKTEVDRRLAEMNDLRHQMDSERGMYLTISRYDDRHESLIEYFNAEIKALEARLALVERREIGKEAIEGNKASTKHFWWLQAGVGVTVLAVFVQIVMRASGLG